MPVEVHELEAVEPITITGRGSWGPGDRMFGIPRPVADLLVSERKALMVGADGNVKRPRGRPRKASSSKRTK